MAKKMTKRNIGKGLLDEEPANDSEQIYSAPTTDMSPTPVTDNEKPANHEEPIDSDRRTDTTEEAQATTDTNENGLGEVPQSVAELLDGPAVENLPREESQADATRRWRRTGIAEQVAVYRDRKREEYSRANPKCKRRDAHEYAWACAMAEFPPPGIQPQIADSIEPDDSAPKILDIEDDQAPKILDTSPADQGVSGLGDLPEAWGVLPANASLQQEIAWVSANRLRVRSGNGVDLSRALSPAPSYSALSWLETSILFPSKFADISVKATAGQEDERESVRREKLAIEEIRSLLAEMLEG